MKNKQLKERLDLRQVKWKKNKKTNRANRYLSEVQSSAVFRECKHNLSVSTEKHMVGYRKSPYAV